MTRSLKSRALLLLTILFCALLGCLLPQYASGKELEDPIIPVCSDDEVDKIIDFAVVEQRIISEKEIELVIKNKGPYQIRNWSVAFNADFAVKSIEGAELVSKKGVIQFKYVSANESIYPGDFANVKLIVSNGGKPIEFFRVYAMCPQLSEDYQVNDCIAHDCATGEEKLLIEGEKTSLYLKNTLDSCFPGKANLSRDKSNPPLFSPNSENDIRSEYLETRGEPGIIGADNRIKVRNVNVGIYRSIGRLLARFPGGAEYTSTAFMISNRNALTAAHCVWNKIGDKFDKPLNSNIRFGENWTRARRVINVSGWMMSAAYRTHPVVANDWACLTLQYPINRGFFNLRTMPMLRLPRYKVGTAGYPIMKRKMIRGWAFYAMYRTSGYVSSVSYYQFTYKMDTTRGQSGSPVYLTGGRSYACGIASRVGGNINAACFLNSGRVRFFKRMGWCG